MSGGQTPRRRSDKQLKYLSNPVPSTTCRYHMPYVVAYVVGHVERAVLYSSLAKASTGPRRGFWHSEWRTFLVYCLHEELCRRVGRIHRHKRHLSDERPSRARDHADLRRCCADVPDRMSAAGESRQTTVEQVSRFCRVARRSFTSGLSQNRT